MNLQLNEQIEAKEFYANRTDKALRNLQEEGYQAIFMPQIVDARIEAPKEARIWQTWYTAPSVRATGKTKQGTPVVVYAHVPNYFSNPDNIEKAIEQGLVKYAGKMPQKEFQRLLDLDDNKNVFVVDYNALKNSTSGIIPVSKALKHPQIIHFLGGEERAGNYLRAHETIKGNKIGVWHSDDLSDKPLGRLLFLGGSCGDGLCGDGLDYVGCFVGVNSAEGGAKKLDTQNNNPYRSPDAGSPTLENTLKTVLDASRDYIPDAIRATYEAKIKEALEKIY